jgi:hypothetical protein
MRRDGVREAIIAEVKAQQDLVEVATREKAARSLIDKFKEEAEMAGLATRAQAIHKLALDGATEAQLRAANAAAEAARVAERTAAVKDLAKKLQEEADTMLLTGAAVDIWKLKQEGATAVEIKHLEALNQVVEARRKEKELADNAKSIADQYADPVAKLKKQATDLQAMFNKGLIDSGVYGRALEDMVAQNTPKGVNVDLGLTSKQTQLLQMQTVGGGANTPEAKSEQHLSVIKQTLLQLKAGALVPQAVGAPNAAPGVPAAAPALAGQPVAPLSQQRPPAGQAGASTPDTALAQISRTMVDLLGVQRAALASANSWTEVTVEL